MNMVFVERKREAHMNLIYRCARCGASVNHAYEDLFADLDGPAFQAYYCAQCAHEFERCPHTLAAEA